MLLFSKTLKQTDKQQRIKTNRLATAKAFNHDSQEFIVVGRILYMNDDDKSFILITEPQQRIMIKTKAEKN